MLSKTLQNLEGALAGESMAHIKYLYFAKIAREEGYNDIADHFEHTANQEIKHAWGHLELLVGQPSTKQCLELAIKGETYEYTEMYPSLKKKPLTKATQMLHWRQNYRLVSLSNMLCSFKNCWTKQSVDLQHWLRWKSVMLMRTGRNWRGYD